MIYGSFRTLVNLLMVLVLGAVFLWGSFRVFGALGGSASAPPPRPTATAVVERPTAPPPPTATKRAGTGTGTHAKATPTPRPTPRPSPTPNVPPKVIVTESQTDSKGANSLSASSIPISGGYPQLWCRARNTALPQQGAVTFTWYQEPNSLLYQRAILRAAGEFTDFYLQEGIFKNPGAKFRCEVAVNGVTVGSAHFTITP